MLAQMMSHVPTDRGTGSRRCCLRHSQPERGFGLRAQQRFRLMHSQGLFRSGSLYSLLLGVDPWAPPLMSPLFPILIAAARDAMSTGDRFGDTEFCKPADTAAAAITAVIRCCCDCISSWYCCAEPG